MSRSRVELKREERRMWSNHKRYLRRRALKPYNRPKAYTMRPGAPKPIEHKPIAAAVAELKPKRLSLFARLWRWIRGKT